MGDKIMTTIVQLSIVLAAAAGAVWAGGKATQSVANARKAIRGSGY